MDINLSLFEGMAIGLVFGIIIGATWERAFEMLREAVGEYQSKHKGNSMAENLRVDERRWLWRLGTLMAFTSVVLVLVGAFMVYSNTRLSNFIQCQATYNQQAYEARQARVESANKENQTLYAWLSTLPPLFKPRDQDEQIDPKLVARFRAELLTAVDTHRVNLAQQRKHPYPPDPQDTCGEY